MGVGMEETRSRCDDRELEVFEGIFIHRSRLFTFKDFAIAGCTNLAVGPE